MATKSILLAFSDTQASADVIRVLGDGWQATSVSTEAEALAHIEQRAFDALLVDFNLGASDASELLNQAWAKSPKTARFLLAYEADLALVAAKVEGPHEILPKPVEPASVKSRIESELAPADAKNTQSGADASATAAPAVPAVYADLLKALESPGVTNSDVADLVAGDTALTTELLKLANSPHLGMAREITDPAEAVEWLGLETVKALVMALRFLAEHSQLRPGYMSLEDLWQHSIQVAQLARDLVLFETHDRVQAAEALVAGLLHDLGKVVLAANFNEWYGRVHSLARKQPVALWDIEKEMFGASHGEIGACLVGMWNLPGSVVDAAAGHHEPPLGEHRQLTPLAAVHIADVLDHEFRPSEEFRVAPVINTHFLNEIGLLQRLPLWRAVLAKGRTAGAGSEVETAEMPQPQIIPPVPASAPPPRTANHLPSPEASTRTATLGQAESEKTVPVALLFRRRRWVYSCAAAVGVTMMILWLGTPSEQPIRALAPAPLPKRTPVVMASAPAPEPASASEPEAEPGMEMSEGAAPAMVPSDEAPATEAVAFLNPSPSLPEPEPTVAPAPVVAVTPAPPPAPVPQEKPQPEFRLSGIIYTGSRSAAIVNRKTVYVGDKVNGATIAGIYRTHVTLQINGQNKTYVLR